MHRLALVLLGLFVAAAWCGCGKKEADRATAPTAMARVQVSTAEELIVAIGPNRTIELSPGEYVLSDVKDRYMDFIRWDPTTAGKTVTIRKVQNLRIVGVGKEPVRLIVRPYSVFVLNFEDCKNVSLENLVLGHAPQEGGCESGVVGATRCSQLRLSKCDLFGSGTEGLTLREVEDFEFEESVIRDCTYGIMTVESCKRLRFSDSRFVKNEQFWAVQMHDSKGVGFVNCVFQDNMADGPLFNVESCGEIRIKGGEVKDNQVKSMTNNTEAVQFEKVKGL